MTSKLVLQSTCLGGDLWKHRQKWNPLSKKFHLLQTHNMQNVSVALQHFCSNLYFRSFAPTLALFSFWNHTKSCKDWIGNDSYAVCCKRAKMQYISCILFFLQTENIANYISNIAVSATTSILVPLCLTCHCLVSKTLQNLVKIW